MLTLRRGLVPACLTLGALLSGLPTLADTPAKPAAQASTAQTIVLQHIVPSDIVKMMHWELASNLPTGVTQIVSVPLQNALLVTATPAGLATVRQMVKLLDIEPRQVQVRFALVHASDAALKASGIDFDLVPLPASDPKPGFEMYASGSLTARFLQTLTEQKALASSTTLTTANNVNASISFFYGPKTPETFAVTPRVNSDDSVTLALHSVFSDGQATHKMETRRTLKSGETMVYVLPPAISGSESFLCFVTPTIK